MVSIQTFWLKVRGIIHRNKLEFPDLDMDRKQSCSASDNKEIRKYHRISLILNYPPQKKGQAKRKLCTTIAIILIL